VFEAFQPPALDNVVGVSAGCPALEGELQVVFWGYLTRRLK
jgi:hypothetical protein